MRRPLARDDPIVDDWMAARTVWRRAVDMDGVELAFMESGPLLNAGAATGSSMRLKVDGVGAIRFDDSDLNRAVGTAVSAATLGAES